MIYPKITKVKTKDNFILEVVFENDIVKFYDCHELLLNPIFEKIRDEKYFRMAEENSGPYAVVWDDNLDIAESEIWIHGFAAS